VNIFPLVEDGFDVSRDSRTTAASVSGATVIPVGDYVSKFVAGNRVAVTLADASTQANTIASVQTAAKTITLGTALSGAATLGGLIRVRVIDTLSGGMDNVDGFVLNGGRDFVGHAHAFFITAISTAAAINQVSPNGGANFITNTTLAPTGNTPYVYSKMGGTHARFMLFNQTTDAFSLYLGLE
jgi:hypothetical protein